MEKSPSASTSIPLVVFFIVLGLKLSGGIAWSWWWVTAPLWIAGGLGIIALLFSLVFLGDAALFLNKVGKPRAPPPRCCGRDRCESTLLTTLTLPGHSGL